MNWATRLYDKNLNVLESYGGAHFNESDWNLLKDWAQNKFNEAHENDGAAMKDLFDYDEEDD
jgi:hypothetical protein